MIAWRGTARLLGVLNTLVLARLLIPADYGLVAMAMAIELALQQMTTFPVYDALLRRPETDTDLHNVAFTIEVARAVLTGAILAACAPLAAAWFGEPRLTALVLALSLVTAVNGLQNVGIVEFQRELRFDVQFRLQLVPVVLQMLVTVGVAWLTHSYWALLAGLAALRVSRVAMSYVIHRYRPRLSLRGWQQLIGFSFWLWLATLAGMLWNDFDPFAVGRVFGSTGLGLYTLAIQVARLPTTELVDPLSTVLLASFAYAQRDNAVAQPDPLRVVLALLLALAPMALVISAGAPDLVAVLLGPKWSHAAPLVVIAAWCAVFYPVQYVCSAALVARGEVRSKFLVTAAGAVLRVTFITLAVSTESLPMVVVGMLVALGGGAAFYVAMAIPELRTGAGHLLGGLLRIGAATVATGLLLAALHLGWQPVSEAARDHRAWEIVALLHLTIKGTVAAGAYGLLILALWLAWGRPDGPETTVFSLVREFLPAGMLRRASARLMSPARR